MKKLILALTLLPYLSFSQIVTGIGTCEVESDPNTITSLENVGMGDCKTVSWNGDYYFFNPTAIVGEQWVKRIQSFIPEATSGMYINPELADPTSATPNTIGTNAIDMVMKRTHAYEAATGHHSIAIGTNNIAQATYATAIGGNSDAYQTYSTAIGNYASATGANSTAIGRHVQAHSYGETVIGTFSQTYTPTSSVSWNLADKSFVVSNGTSNIARSNVFTIFKSGAVGFDKVTDNTVTYIPNPLEGMMIYNEDQLRFEYYNGTSWGSLGGESIWEQELVSSSNYISPIDDEYKLRIGANSSQTPSATALFYGADASIFQTYGGTTKPTSIDLYGRTWEGLPSNPTGAGINFYTGNNSFIKHSIVAYEDETETTSHSDPDLNNGIGRADAMVVQGNNGLILRTGLTTGVIDIGVDNVEIQVKDDSVRVNGILLDSEGVKGDEHKTLGGDSNGRLEWRKTYDNWGKVTSTALDWGYSTDPTDVPVFVDTQTGDNSHILPTFSAMPDGLVLSFMNKTAVSKTILGHFDGVSNVTITVIAGETVRFLYDLDNNTYWIM